MSFIVATNSRLPPHARDKIKVFLQHKSRKQPEKCNKLLSYDKLLGYQTKRNVQVWFTTSMICNIQAITYKNTSRNHKSKRAISRPRHINLGFGAKLPSHFAFCTFFLGTIHFIYILKTQRVIRILNQRNYILCENQGLK